MIHNSYLIRISNKEILASTKYWPVDISTEAIDEFIDTREDLRSEGEEVPELALTVGSHKFHAKDVISDVLLVFVTDKEEEESSIFEKVTSGRDLLKKVLLKSGLDAVRNNFEKLIEPSVITRLKIALVGEGGVGKTTTLHLLLGDTPPLQYVPTIALNLETVENIRFGNYSLVLWDFAGQERFRTLWRFYFHGADVIFLVCDSALRNVIISKDILKLIKRDAPKVPVFAMANKQDKPNAMKPEVVQKILGIPTYPMVAIDKSRRDEMLRILMTAASQYVGVALPDLPPSELLKFTDTATEEAIAEVDAMEEAHEEEEEEEEYEEVIEEVLVDEEGHIIENLDDYEIIEEVVEEIVEDEEEEEAEAIEEPEEVLIEEEAEAEVEKEPEEMAIEVSSEEAPAEEVEETPVEEPEEILVADEPRKFYLDEGMDLDKLFSEEEPEEMAGEAEPVSIETSPHEEEIEIDIDAPVMEDEVVPVEVAMSEEDAVHEEVEQIELAALESLSDPTETTEVESGESITDESEEDEIFATSDSPEPKVVVVPNNHDVRMAKEIIFEALEADDIISAEIDRVPQEDLDDALEAFGSDEALPTEEEEDVMPEAIDKESLEELESILGPLDKSVGGYASENEHAEEDHLPIDNDSLKELSDLLDFVESDEDEY